MTYWSSWTKWLLAPPEQAKTSRKAIDSAKFEIGGLRLRFLIIVYFALFPVAVLSVWQGFDRLRLDQENVRENLRQSAYAAASDELNVFATAEQMLRTLSTESDVRSGAPGCRTRLIKALEGLKFFVNLARISPAGGLLCIAVTPPRLTDLTQAVWWKGAREHPQFSIVGPIRSEALGRAVLIGVLPITNADGSFDGFLNVAIDVAWLDFIQHHKRLVPGAVVALFDKAGSVVATNNTEVAKSVFAGGANVKQGEDGLLSANAPTGEAWTMAVAPVIRRDYFVGFAMPSYRLFRFTYVHVTVDLLLPVLMILLASLAIWAATDRLAVQWIVLLQRMAAAYGAGHYAIRPLALTRAPREFQALGDALSNMAQAVQERDKHLRDSVAQKALLIKEVHHRVKNNLQIVISLLSLQAGKLKDPAARDALEQARTRVNALALVHRMIYELDNGGLVDLNPLINEVSGQLHQGLGGDRRKISLRVDVPSYNTDADTAIPLTLFVIEALTNAFKHGFETGAAKGTISVELSRLSPERLKFVVADDGQGLNLEASPREQSTGSRLISAFAHQVGGIVATSQREGGGTVVVLEFPDRSHGAGGVPLRDEPNSGDADGASGGISREAEGAAAAK